MSQVVCCSGPFGHSVLRFLGSDMVPALAEVVAVGELRVLTQAVSP